MSPLVRLSGCRAAAGALLALLLGLFAPGAVAGELAVAWTPNADALTAGYDVELLDADGRLLRTIDAGSATSIRIPDLEDGRRYGVRVRPYDIWGNRARSATRTLATLPEPRVESLEGRLRPGRFTLVSVHGVNFDDGARLLVDAPGIEVGTVTVIDTTLLLAELRAVEGAAPPAPGQIAVLNPVRRTAAYVAAHPRLLDADRSGSVDEADIGLLTSLFGTTRDDPNYCADCDPNGDGVIDGEDAALVRAALARPGGPERGAAP